MTTVKQIIVIRKDLKMRRGKEVAQGAHSAMGWLLNRLQQASKSLDFHGQLHINDIVLFSAAETTWMTGEYRKVVCQVETEQELRDLYIKAKAVGLEAHLVTDLGMTEFHGTPTVTCLAIGPDYAEKIDPLTSSLSLY